MKTTRTRVLARDVDERAHHRREAALHVVGAAADEPVALDPRRELLVVRRDDVDVAVQDHGRADRRADRGEDDGQAVEVAHLVLDLVRSEPPLDEGRCVAHTVRGGGVVRHQPLREGALVHRVSLATGSRGPERATDEQQGDEQGAEGEHGVEPEGVADAADERGGRGDDRGVQPETDRRRRAIWHM